MPSIEFGIGFIKVIDLPKQLLKNYSSHAPAWELILQRSSVAIVTLERHWLRFHARAWKR